MNTYDVTIDGRNKSYTNIATISSGDYPIHEENRMVIENPTGMMSTLISQAGKMVELFLPYPAKGVYYFSQNILDNVPIHFEAKNEKWYAIKDVSSRFISMQDPFAAESEVSNQDLILIRKDSDLFMLYTEELNQESMVRHNYVVLPSDLFIGRNDDNDIVYSAAMISGKHAVIHYNGKRWSVRDLDSRNGIFVNGYRVINAELSLGDEIYIYGLKIIIGSGFLSINDGNNRVYVNRKKIRAVTSTANVMRTLAPDNVVVSDNEYNRSPRSRIAFEKKTINFELPPMSLGNERLPMLMRMGSSLVMGGSAALTGNVAMLAGSVLLPMLSQQYSKEEREEYEERRRVSYNKYLNEKKHEIQTEIEKEEWILRHNYPDMQEVLSYVSGGEKLWERGKDEDDFLKLRIGCGQAPINAEIRFPDRHFEMDEDDLRNKMYSLADKDYYLQNVPILLDLIKYNVVGVCGNTEKIRSFINGLIMRLSLLFSYDEVKMIVLLDEEDLNEMEYIRCLPHMWDDQRNIRFVAVNDAETYQISEHLQKVLENDLEKARGLETILKERPYYIIFSLNKKLFENAAILQTIMKEKDSLGVSIFAVHPDLPKECQVLLEINEDDDNRIIFVTDIDHKDVVFSADSIDEENAAYSMRLLANTKLRLISQAYSLPKSYGFLEMYGVGKIEDLNIRKRWEDSNPVKSLAAPIGIGTDGELFYLNLHEKFQGPHGLVAGMTGSGKSEFLLSYILSMAINYSPEEVAFILIDYKGGGLAGAFVDEKKGIHLPHIVGTITNLDGAAIQRNMICIESEMKRRQSIFNNAKSISNQGTMDIYNYQKLFRQGIVDEPLPHLFIISDEFAELKQQQPEFMDELISIARIGRSLGVHLILATQKPAGIVNDQIRSNAKFKICLKVQDKQDSTDMLKRPEAAELKETGRFYLQVGYNEFFALGQSAWSGAMYEPSDQVISKKDDTIQFIDLVGQEIYSIKPEVKKSSTQKTQLVAIVEELQRLAENEKIEPLMLWKPELSSAIDIASISINENSGIQIPIGVIDEPEKQQQFSMILNMNKLNHILFFGESGMGKSTALQTIMMSVIQNYKVEEVNFYILDFASRSLAIFKNAPHCGGIITEDTKDDLFRFVRLLDSIINERTKLFAELGVDNYNDAILLQKIPMILIFIDNLAGTAGTKVGDALYYAFPTYLKKCSSLGIQFIATCTRPGEILSRIRPEFGTNIAFAQKDKYEFSDAICCRCSYIPPSFPGRGLIKYQEKPLEIQMAMYNPAVQGIERTKEIRKLCDSLADSCGECTIVKQIPEIKKEITYSEFISRIKQGRVPLGYSIVSAKEISLPLKQLSMMSVYFGSNKLVKPVTANLMSVAKRENARIYVIKKLSHSIFNEGMECSPEKITEFWKELLPLFQERKALIQSYCDNNKIDKSNKDNIYKYTFSYAYEQTQPIFIFIESFRDLCENGNQEALDVLSGMFALSRLYNIYIIGYFYADETVKLSSNNLYKKYNPEQIVLLFGNQLDKQSLCTVPRDVANNLDMNQFLMKYQDQLHALYMPLEIIDEEIDEDDKAIFEV